MSEPREETREEKIVRLYSFVETCLQETYNSCQVCFINRETLDRLKTNITRLTSRFQNFQDLPEDRDKIFELVEQLIGMLRIKKLLYKSISRHYKSHHLE